MFKYILLIVALLSMSVFAAPDDVDFTAEMNALDLGSIISAPMTAAIRAQASAAKTTVNFVTELGFVTNATTGAKEVINVEFVYRAQETNGSTTLKRMSVPFLYLIPIPFIRIDSLKIEFSMKLTSVATENRNTSLNASGALNLSIGRNSTGGGPDFLPSPINVAGSVAVTSKTAENVEIKRTYGLTIKVEAVQGGMPGGMEQIFALFEKIIRTDLPATDAPSSF